MTINIKRTFFKGSSLSKTIPNVSPLLYQGFKICPYQDYAATINRNSLCVTDLILGLTYVDCLLFSLFTYIFDLVITHRMQQNKIWTQSCQGYILKLETKFPDNSLISPDEIQQISVISTGHMSGGLWLLQIK